MGLQCLSGLKRQAPVSEIKWEDGGEVGNKQQFLFTLPIALDGSAFTEMKRVVCSGGGGGAVAGAGRTGSCGIDGSR